MTVGLAMKEAWVFMNWPKSTWLVPGPKIELFSVSTLTWAIAS